MIAIYNAMKLNIIIRYIEIYEYIFVYIFITT